MRAEQGHRVFNERELHAALELVADALAGRDGDVRRRLDAMLTPELVASIRDALNRAAALCSEELLGRLEELSKLAQNGGRS